MFDDRQHAARQIAKHLFHLLTPEEDQLRYNRFDIQLLTQRLVAANQVEFDFSINADYFLRVMWSRD